MKSKKKTRRVGRAAGIEGVETQNVTALVPVFRLKKLKEQLARMETIAKRAKLPFSYEIGDADETLVMSFLDETDAKLGRKAHKKKVAAARVSVSGIMVPKIHGWRLIAALEGISTPEGKTNLVFPFDERYPVDAKYQNLVGVCDHCKKARQRLTTFVLRSDKGQEKMVGRNCLADFLNTTDVSLLMESAATLSELLVAENPEGSDEEESLYGASGVSDFEIERVLFFTAWEARRSGYLSSKRAEALSESEGRPIMSTMMFVERLLRSPEDQRYGNEWREVRRVWNEKNSEEHVLNASVVKKTRELFASLPDTTSDYVRNVKLYLSRGFVLPKHLGLVGSAIGYYLAEEKKRVEAARSKDSVFLGEVGKDLYVPAATLIFHKTYSSRYGVSYLHIFETPEKNRIVWFSSSTDLEKRKGETMSLLGKVKAHEEKSGVKETILTRATADALPPPPPKEPKRSAEARASTAAKKAAKSLEKYLAGLRAGIALVAGGGYTIEWDSVMRRAPGGYHIAAELGEYSIARPSDKKVSGLEKLAMLGAGADKKMNSTEAKAFSEYMAEELVDYHTEKTTDVPFAALVAWSQGRPATAEEKLSSTEKDRIKRNLEMARVLTAGFAALKGTPFMKMLEEPSGGMPGDEREVSTVQVTRIWNAGSDALGMDTARGSGLYAVERLFRDEFGARYLRRDNDMSVYEGVRLRAIKDWVRKTAEGRAYGSARRRGR